MEGRASVESAGDESRLKRDFAGPPARLQIGEDRVGHGVGVAHRIDQQEVEGIGVERCIAPDRQRHRQNIAPRVYSRRKKREERAARDVVVCEEEGVGQVGLRPVAFREHLVGLPHDVLMSRFDAEFFTKEDILNRGACRAQRVGIKNVAWMHRELDKAARAPLPKTGKDGREGAFEIEPGGSDTAGGVDLAGANHAIRNTPLLGDLRQMALETDDYGEVGVLAEGGVERRTSKRSRS